jgi:hypothetical protein
MLYIYRVQIVDKDPPIAGPLGGNWHQTTTINPQWYQKGQSWPVSRRLALAASSSSLGAAILGLRILDWCALPLAPSHLIVVFRTANTSLWPHADSRTQIGCCGLIPTKIVAQAVSHRCRLHAKCHIPPTYRNCLRVCSEQRVKRCKE